MRWSILRTDYHHWYVECETKNRIGFAARRTLYGARMGARAMLTCCPYCGRQHEPRCPEGSEARELRAQGEG